MRIGIIFSSIGVSGVAIDTDFIILALVSGLAFILHRMVWISIYKK
jgi:hypothetical protein